MTQPTPWPQLRRNLVDYDRLLQAITVEGEVLAQTADRAEGDLPVPGCPGLTVTHTVRHTGGIYRRVLEWIRSDGPPDEWQQEPSPGQHLIDFFTEGRIALVAELAAHEPDEPCDTWWPIDQTYGFWRRRMAHETTIHRVDVQAAAGVDVELVADDFAVDGIDEVLQLWFGHQLTRIGMASTLEGAVGVQAAGRSWLAVLGRTRCSARRVPTVDAQAADAVITSDPMNVYLWLWGRVPDQAITITGDIDASAQLWALLRSATQ